MNYSCAFEIASRHLCCAHDLYYGKLITCYQSEKICMIFYMKPMELEQVLSDRDSEDEVDDDIADLEDRRVCMIFF